MEGLKIYSTQPPLLPLQVSLFQRKYRKSDLSVPSGLRYWKVMD